MKFIILTLGASILAIVGYLVYTWDNFTYKTASTTINNNLSMSEVWQEYKEYWLAYEPNMTAPATCKPHSEDEIKKLEVFFKFTLPKELKESFRIVNHSGKKCDDNLYHSWFGSKTGITLFTPNSILIESKNMQKQIEFSKDAYYIYDGNISPLGEKDINWPKTWVPIMSKYDITFFIDLRKNIGAEYGQVIAYLHTFEGLKNEGKPPSYLLDKLDNYTPNPNNSFNNFVLIAKDYKTFMQLMLEEIKENGEVKDRYLTHLFNLKSDYFW